MWDKGTLSVTLLNLAINMYKSGFLKNKGKQIIAYADDTIAKQGKEMKEILETLVRMKR